jgi:hypothetical protein
MLFRKEEGLHTEVWPLSMHGSRPYSIKKSRYPALQALTALLCDAVQAFGTCKPTIFPPACVPDTPKADPGK